MVHTCFGLVGRVFCERIGMCTLICRGDVVQHLGMIRELLIALYLQVILNPCVHRMERQVDASLNGRSCNFHCIYLTSTTCKHIIYILLTHPGCPPAPPTSWPSPTRRPCHWRPPCHLHDGMCPGDAGCRRARHGGTGSQRRCLFCK